MNGHYPDNYMSTRVRTSGLLYPMLVIAAIAVTVFSIVGIATMMGWMPGALSVNAPAATPNVGDARPSARVPRSPSVATGKGSPLATCRDCGVIESVRALDVPGESAYQVRVRMEDGSHRTFTHRSRPGLAVGQQVRVTASGIAARG